MNSFVQISSYPRREHRKFAGVQILASFSVLSFMSLVLLQLNVEQLPPKID